MKAEELRIGNIVEYLIEDDMDERQRYWEITTIDVIDLSSIKLGLDYHYRPITLTTEWLEGFGFEKRESSTCTQWYIGKNEVTKDWLFDLVWLDKPELINAPGAPFYRNVRHTIHHVHQLQNLYFAMTGEELELKPELK